jgi:hypothetical protein
VAGRVPGEHGAMNSSPAQMRTLARALKGCGSESALAKALGVAIDDVGRWLRGHEAVPASIYFKALDLVASGAKRR